MRRALPEPHQARPARSQAPIGLNSKPSPLQALCPLQALPVVLHADWPLHVLLPKHFVFT
jgi:hypothetical protein